MGIYIYVLYVSSGFLPSVHIRGLVTGVPISNARRVLISLLHWLCVRW